mmetsp:Transcript_61383/g.69558  ORF Transcript_61383/g.69558 Transcript_61383/m.69558 type:complete len:291 (-) Transcript_61383:22-894(-)
MKHYYKAPCSSSLKLKTMVVVGQKMLLLLSLLLLLSVCITTVRAFSPVIPTTTSIDVLAGCHNIYSRERNFSNRRQRRQFFEKQDHRSSQRHQHQQRQVLLFLSNSDSSSNDDDNNIVQPPPLSPLSINNGNYEYDDFTPAEVTKMRDLIVSLSDETDDTNRRQRLQKTIEEALIHDDGDGGPNSSDNANANGTQQSRRFTILFSRVLTQVGEQVQQDAREKFSEKSAEDDDDDHNETDSSDDTKKEEEDKDEDETVERIVREKSPEELKLWALVDMMVQSKTVFKKCNF